jgi:hypothetical protein
VEGARPLLGKLQELEPEGARAAEIAARLQHAQREDGKAAALLEGFVRARDAPVIENAAALLEELGLTAAAEAMYRFAVASAPPSRRGSRPGHLAPDQPRSSPRGNRRSTPARSRQRTFGLEPSGCTTQQTRRPLAEGAGAVRTQWLARTGPPTAALGSPVAGSIRSGAIRSWPR